VIAAARRRGQDVRIGGELYGDAAGDAGTPQGTYVGMIRHNIDTIHAGLTDAAPPGG
jgi:manganese/zinc/iron transport system substrate-binding protein